MVNVVKQELVLRRAEPARDLTPGGPVLHFGRDGADLSSVLQQPLPTMLHGTDERVQNRLRKVRSRCSVSCRRSCSDCQKIDWARRCDAGSIRSARGGSLSVPARNNSPRTSSLAAVTLLCRRTRSSGNSKMVCSTSSLSRTSKRCVTAAPCEATDDVAWVARLCWISSTQRTTAAMRAARSSDDSSWPISWRCPSMRFSHVPRAILLRSPREHDAGDLGRPPLGRVHRLLLIA